MRKTLHALLSLTLALAVLCGTLFVGGAFPTLPSAAETPEYYVIDNCDTLDKFTSFTRDTTEKKQGKASVRTGGNGTVDVNNAVTFKMNVPEDFTDWYLEMWIYVDYANRLTMSECYVELNTNNSTYVRYKMSKMTIRNGWNKIKVKISSASEKAKMDEFTQINRVRLSLKTTSQVSIRLDDICLSKSDVASDKSVLEAALTKAETFDTTGANEALIEDFEKAKTRAQNAFSSASTSQREADVCAEVLADAMNAFTFEGFVQDDSTDYAYVDYSDMAYSMMDGFRVVDGSIETYNERNAMKFTGQLFLNPAAKYVVAGSNDLRFSFMYFDGESGGLELYYGSENGEKKALTVPFEGGNRWKTATVRVKDAALARNISGYDLVLKVTGGAAAYVCRAEITVITSDQLDEKEPPVFQPETAINNIIGAGCIGYQMWFSAGDSWVHWGTSTSANPAPGNGNLSFDVYPYVQDYLDNGATLHESNLGLLGDGSQSVLFNSKDKEIVETHFQWIKEYGIDCMAVQRFGFGDNGRKIADEHNHLLLVRDMAEKYDRTFYVMYDVSGQGGLSYDEFYERMTNDWVLNIEQSGVCASTHYAHADGKPVVCIWGITGEKNSDYPNGDTASRVIRWFQERGYFVILGTPDNNYTERTGEYLEPFLLANMISPWTVGRYNHASCISWIKNNAAKDVRFCETYDKEYQPVVFPGFSWTTMLHTGKPNAYPRYAGEFIWRQVTEYKKLGVSNIYLAMFDEYDEGTAYMKGATDYFEIPTAQYFVTYAADGHWLSNDYYLRTAQKAIQLIKDETTDTQLNIPYSQGPIYWRNSFEKRWTTYLTEDSQQIEHTVLCNIDPCSNLSMPWDDTNAEVKRKRYTGMTDYVSVKNDTNPDQYGTSLEGTGIFRDVSGKNTKSGEWAYQLEGSASANGASLVQMVSTANVMVSAAGLTLDYSLFAVNDLGRNVHVDLLLDDDTLVSDVVSTVKTARGKVGQWVDVSVSLPSSLVGRYIKYVVISYKGNAGDFNAYIDDVILQSPGSEKTMLQKALETASAIETDSEVLAAAIAAGQMVFDNNAASAKQRLKAMQAIDNAIRVEGLTVKGDNLMGDVNSDGKVNTTDARVVLQYAAGLIGDDALNLSVADVKSDGKVNTTDARSILQYAAGLIQTFD